MDTNIQNLINDASEKLFNAYDERMTAIVSAKGLKKDLKDDLLLDNRYIAILQQEKAKKALKKDMLEDLKELKKEREAIAMELESYQELEDFMDRANEKFWKIKDEVIKEFSRTLSEQGIIAEIQFKGGQLILIVARV